MTRSMASPPVLYRRAIDAGSPRFCAIGALTIHNKRAVLNRYENHGSRVPTYACRFTAIVSKTRLASTVATSPHFCPSRQCCIAAKCYSLGARFLEDQPIFSVDPAATGLTPVQFLRYFYYGGIVYTGVKQWKHALDSFLTVSRRCLLGSPAVSARQNLSINRGVWRTLCHLTRAYTCLLPSHDAPNALNRRHSRSLLLPQLITTPANVLSSIVVEGYKKMLLINLITSGNAPTLPKYTSNSVSRHLKNYTSEYEALATSCKV